MTVLLEQVTIQVSSSFLFLEDLILRNVHLSNINSTSSKIIICNSTRL
jgi:hypothetical protein